MLHVMDVLGCLGQTGTSECQTDAVCKSLPFSLYMAMCRATFEGKTRFPAGRERGLRVLDSSERSDAQQRKFWRFMNMPLSPSRNWEVYFQEEVTLDSRTYIVAEYKNSPKGHVLVYDNY